MDFLTPNLLRVLKPGRLAAIHVKDRIVPGGMTGLGFQTVYPFHARCIEHYKQHGFAYMGMKTIVTDVVRENNQTYRLGWSEQCKDGTTSRGLVKIRSVAPTSAGTVVPLTSKRRRSP